MSTRGKRLRVTGVAAAVGFVTVAVSMPATGAVRSPATASQHSADVAVSVAVNPQSTQVGQTVTFTVTATNNGPDKATAVKVVFGVSTPQPTLVSASTGGLGACVINVRKTLANCLIGTLQSGSSEQITVTAQPQSSGEVVGTAKIGERAADPDPSNDIAQVKATVGSSSAPVGVQITGEALSQAFQTKPTFKVKWTASDAASPIASYDVRYRVARFRHAFGPFVAWKTAFGAKTAKLAAALGATLCFSVRATNAVGNVSGWSFEACTAVPLGPDAFTRKGPWEMVAHSTAYAGSYLYTKVKGAELDLPNVTAKHLALVVTRCPRCGAIEAFWNGRPLKTVNLVAAFSEKRQLVDLAQFASRQTGTLKLMVVSLKGSVKIEGVGVSAV
jgi:Domain of unknown function DUF11